MTKLNQQGNALMIGLGVVSLILVLGAIGGYYYFVANKPQALDINAPITTPSSSKTSFPTNNKSQSAPTTGTQVATSTVAPVKSAADLDKISKDLDATNFNVSSDITQ